ncbi:MAG: isoprenylcysteine carboxylmethyltransferase family protein [Pseudomonadales bacterium]|nr:isoprenylcysteine carboxylmethyltransferase family protein [Pseudomonadales bacterium]MCP5183762.1 isoprenylcysteine carboxylmethyltransferase family protein [Pseudomonadales bacterium]
MRALLLYYTGFLILVFVWPTLRLWQRTGINALVVTFGDDLHGYAGRGFRLLLACALPLLGAHGALPAGVFGPLPWLGHTAISVTGWCMLLTSMLWIVWAQAIMGRSWRIGIDNTHPGTLVAHGPFRMSRNPIFLGLRINLLGVFLVIPDATTLCVFVAAEILLQVQVRLEEQYLAARHGAAYADYRGRVARWFGWEMRESA